MQRKIEIETMQRDKYARDLKSQEDEIEQLKYLKLKQEAVCAKQLDMKNQLMIKLNKYKKLYN